MKLFNKVAIIGVGLIGGSLGLALKKRRLVGKVIGVARHKETLRLAKKIGAIDIGSTDINIIKDADFIVLAAPVNTIINIAKKISKIVKKGCVVIDVGSTKKEVVSKLENLFSNYIGTHPLAGSQKSGVMYACADMFKNSLCVLTPTSKTKSFILKKISKLWKEVGARVTLISPQGHDRIVSLVSQLPHLVAFSLIDLVPERYLKFAASGLKDTTRIASSEPHLWLDIFMSNRKEILKALKGFKIRLNKFESLLEKKDIKGIYSFMKKAKQKRDNLI